MTLFRGFVRKIFYRRSCRPLLAVPLAVAVVLGSAVPTFAGTTEEAALRQRVEQLERELQELKRLIDVRADETKQAIDNIEKEARSGATVTTKGGIKVESADGNFSAQIGGRLLVDSAVHDEDKSNLGNGTEVRQARLFLKGTLFRDWGYKSQFDFAKNNVSVKDNYISYRGLAPVKLMAGNFKEPFGLSEKTSRLYMAFMERAVPDVFAPGRHIGFQADTHGANWTVATGVFGSTVNGDAAGEGDEGFDAAGRVTYAPFHEKTGALHLGLAARYREPDDETTRFRIKPEADVTNVRFLDTGTLANVDNFVTVQPELAFVYGPFSAQGEYVRTEVDRSGPSGDLTFDGWYAQGSYFLTGESRNYQADKGGFGRVTPFASVFQGGLGAWEVGVRYSTLGLNDGSVRAGRERNLTVGLNWYLNPHLRLMFNYVRVDNDAGALGNAANLKPGEAFAGDDDPEIFQLRAQVDF